MIYTYEDSKNKTYCKFLFNHHSFFLLLLCLYVQLAFVRSVCHGSQRRHFRDSFRRLVHGQGIGSLFRLLPSLLPGKRVGHFAFVALVERSRDHLNLGALALVVRYRVCRVRHVHLARLLLCVLAS